MASAESAAAQCGSVWQAWPTPPPFLVKAMATLPSGDLVAGGASIYANNGAVARWTGTAWQTIGTLAPAASSQVFGITLAPNGDLIVTGFFSSVNGVAAQNIARWNGTSWAPLGSGLVGQSAYANRSVFLPNGDLVVGGWFTNAGVIPVRNIARWNGASWTPLAAGVDGDVRAIAVRPNGDVVATGWFYAAFNTPGVPVPNTAVLALWNGTAWSSIGAISSSEGPGEALHSMPNGDLILAGNIGSVQGVLVQGLARWNGTSWSGAGGISHYWLGNSVYAMLTLPNGDLLATGWFGGLGVGSIARWNGASWSPVGSGLTYEGRALTRLADDSVAVGGSFATAGGVSSPNLAQITTSCPAATQVTGPGCGASGTNVLTASLPWIGATWEARATGLPASALTFSVLGMQGTTLPLTAVFATAIPGCTLHVQPDVVQLSLAAQTTQLQFALPNDPPLVGVTFHHQVVSLALDPTLAVTATNALTMTIGSF